MQYSVTVYIPNKPQYSRTHTFDNVTEAAQKVVNNIYVCATFDDAERIISEYDDADKGPTFWCNVMNGAYVEVTPLNGKTTLRKQAA